VRRGTDEEGRGKEEEGRPEKEDRRRDFARGREERSLFSSPDATSFTTCSTCPA
jgi:hypothetical protein